MAGRWPFLVRGPRPALDPDGRQVDRNGPLGGGDRRHHADRNRRRGAHEHPGSASHPRTDRPWDRRSAGPGGGRDRRLAAAAPQSPVRCHGPSAHRRLVEPSAGWLRHLRPSLLPRPHLPLDVGHRSLAQLVRAPLAQAHARLDPGRSGICHQHPEHSERPERIRARDAGVDAGAAAVDQLHGLDCQCNAGQGQAHGRRAVGLLGERPRGDGRAYRPGHHAAPAVHRRQNARPGVGSLHELGAASAAPQQSRHFPDRRRTRRDRLQ